MTIDDVNREFLAECWTLWARQKSDLVHWHIVEAGSGYQWLRMVQEKMDNTDDGDTLEYLLLEPGELPILLEVEWEPEIGEES